MTVEAKKIHHHHHQRSHQHGQQTPNQHPVEKMVQLKSLERITHLPVFESVQAHYDKMKSSNVLIKWSLYPAETGMWLAVGTAMPVISYFEKPVAAVDGLLCSGLDIIEANVPAINYPPELVFNMTKDYVSSKVVTPVLNRADSVKRLSISGASNIREHAAHRLNNAIDVADLYVEKYLPEITDAPDSTTDPTPAANPDTTGRNKTIQHVNQFSRKLQRRLTRRTIVEARALRQQGAETLRSLVYLVDLLARDPKLFMEKAREVWQELSKDEPENQVPPANLEQLVAMLSREMARRIVHLANYTSVKLVLFSQYSLHVAHIGALNAVVWADYLIKMMNLEPAVETMTAQISRLHQHSLDLLAKLAELIRNLKLEGMKTAEKALQQPQLTAVTQAIPLPFPSSFTNSLTAPSLTTPSTPSNEYSTPLAPSPIVTTNNKQQQHQPASQNGETLSNYDTKAS